MFTIFLDYAKAFDRCQHKTMVKIIHVAGLDMDQCHE